MNFWIAAGALLLLALAMLLPPLLRALRAPADDQRRQQNIAIAREQKMQLDAQLEAGEMDRAAYDAAYADLQNALALELERDEVLVAESRGRWLAPLLLVALPAASILLYQAYGEYRVITNPQLALAPAHGTPDTANAPQMTLEEMETAIRERLRDEPEDAEGWFMLGRTYMGMQDYDRAVAAYQRSSDLAPEEPGILFALADALAMAAGGVLAGEPEKLVERGLELAPDFTNGLWLAGIAAEQRGDLAAAHRYWTRLLPLVADNPRNSSEVQALLQSLEEREPALASASPPASASAAVLEVDVDIDPALRERAAPDTVVFVFARAEQGPPMPLAVRRLRLAELPASVTLSDADAMMPAMKLSSFDRVVVGARVSFSGNPIAQAGDFFAEIGGIDTADPSLPIRLSIDQVKP